MSGLTNDNPKVALETVRALIEMGKGFKLLEERGLEKLAKDAFALSEFEERKSKEARENIARYESLIAEQKKQQKVLEDMAAKNEADSIKLTEGWAKLSKEAGELKKWEKELATKADEVGRAKIAVQDREHAVEVRESKVAITEAKAAENLKEATRIKDEMKARADQMKGITEGL